MVLGRSQRASKGLGGQGVLGGYTGQVGSRGTAYLLVQCAAPGCYLSLALTESRPALRLSLSMTLCVSLLSALSQPFRGGTLPAHPAGTIGTVYEHTLTSRSAASGAD